MALMVRIAAWRLFPNIHAADEVFQYQEPAFRLVEGYGVITWEYIEGVRSWLLPGFLAALLWISDFFLGDIGAWSAFIGVSLSILSLVVVWAMAEYGRWVWGLRGAVLAGGVGVIWYELVYFAPKSLTSPVATHLMIAALLAWGLGLRKVSHLRLVVGGFLVVLAFVVRPQLAVGLAVLTLGFIWGEDWRMTARWVLLGCAVGLGATGLLDMLAFDYPFQWLVDTYRFQIELGVFDGFGVEPWNWYARWLIQSWFYLAPLLLLLFSLGIRRLPVLGATAVAIGATYSAFGHKEYRFIYPVIVLILVIASVGLVELLEKSTSGKPSPKTTSALIGVVLLVIGLAAAERSFSDLEPGWTRNSQTIKAFEVLREEPGVESILLDGVRWTSTPGYTVLRRDVPLRLRLDQESLQKLEGRYTHVLTVKEPDEIPPAHVLIDSWNVSETVNLYLYRYEGEFTMPPSLTLNDQLREQWLRFRASESSVIAPG